MEKMLKFTITYMNFLKAGFHDPNRPFKLRVQTWRITLNKCKHIILFRSVESGIRLTFNI